MVTQNLKQFKKSKESSRLHKNLFFALVYFHSVLVGRKKYGSVGWNVPYQFDLSDFDISALQLYQLLKKSSTNDQTGLKMVRYMIGEINYAGKIQRNQDNKIMQAVMDDLFAEDLAASKVRLKPDLDRSHYGIPELFTEDEIDQGRYQQFINKLPESDQEKIFGFNHNIERMNAKNMIFDILKKVYQMNTKSVPFNNPLDISTKDENDTKVKEICTSLLKGIPLQF